jgi:RNA polymerase sigma factor (TIGR02999 family)
MSELSDPPKRQPGAVTVLLGRLQSGDRAGLPELIQVVYPELRRVAGGLLRRERPGHILQPTALVHETYVRLVDHDQHNWQNRSHFFGAAAQLMRRILVDHARASQAQKRGGNGVRAVRVPDVIASEPSVNVLALDRALDRLEQVSPRQVRIVELRYFAGLSVSETAEALGMTTRTVDRDWAAARVWLRRQLQP